MRANDPHKEILSSRVTLAGYQEDMFSLRYLCVKVCQSKFFAQIYIF